MNLSVGRWPMDTRLEPYSEATGFSRWSVTGGCVSYLNALNGTRDTVHVVLGRTLRGRNSHRSRSNMNESCRLCGGTTTVVFTRRVLQRFEVDFRRCEDCESLQTERPYWLNEAYSSAIASMDTGAVERNLICQAAISCVAAVLRLKGRVLDYGAGTGLLCRLLRDRGHDAYAYDKYAQPAYAAAFSVDQAHAGIEPIDLLCAIEVFEHFDDPDSQLTELFALRPNVFVATTIPYKGEGKDWWYLSADTGQHVFFYSSKALKTVAAKFGYIYLEVGTFHIFSKSPVSRTRQLLIRLGLSSIGRRIGRIWIAATQQGTYANQDYWRLAEKVSHGVRERAD